MNAKRTTRRAMQFGRRSTDADMSRTLNRVRKLAEREAAKFPEFKPSPRPRKWRGRALRSPPESAINANCSLHCNMAEVMALPPKQRKAFIEGIGKVVATSGRPNLA